MEHLRLAVLGAGNLCPCRSHGGGAVLRALVLALLLLGATPASAAQLLNVAQKYVGLHERTHNATLRKLLGVNPRAVKWCGYFMTAVVRKVGGKVPASSARAISWRTVGKPVTLKSARRGDLLVMRSHVTIYTGKRKGNRICGLGGNQSNAVRESCYSAGRIIAIRRVG